MEASIRIYVYIQRGKGLCVCPLDIDKLGCRKRSMALEHRCVSREHPSTYALICTATCARRHAHAESSAAPPRTRAAHASATDRARSAAVRVRAGSGAYVGQVRDSRGVPRADVRVEGRRRVERLRAEFPTLGGVKGSHAPPRMRSRQRTHTSVRVRMHERQRRTVSPAHTGALACMGEAPTHPPAHV
jgi:hypothetical protein